MRIVGVFSFNNGREVVRKQYPHLLKEVEDAIAAVRAGDHLTKKTKEKTMWDKLLYSPRSMNKAFKEQFFKRGWKSVRAKCTYSTDYYADEFAEETVVVKGAYREMDFVKEKLGVEVQFGKYSFMVYNVCAKMTIFKNLGHIEAGVEIVPVKELASGKKTRMSTGVSYFEQFVWDLEKRGLADIDIPVLILGVTTDKSEKREQKAALEKKSAPDRVMPTERKPAS